MDDKNKDVPVDPSPTPKPGEGPSNPEPGQDDKDKNFAELRTKKEQLEKENEDLRKENESLKKPADDSKKDIQDPLKVVFDRDLKEATFQWSEKNKPTADDWAELKKKVTFKGDETLSEIKAKMSEAYETLPSVKQRKEKELIDKGRKQAMREFNDEEMDFGGGGDVDLGGGSNTSQLNSKEKKFLKNFGVTPEEAKKINKDETPNTGWTVLDPAYKNK